jgi:hypothetical protein
MCGSRSEMFHDNNKKGDAYMKKKGKKKFIEKDHRERN